MGVEANRLAWWKIESAKRRLVYSLLGFGLPLRNRIEDPVGGLAVHLLADQPGLPRVMTGHDEGIITMNISEADDVERERTPAFAARALSHARSGISAMRWGIITGIG